ncbi:MAG: hypothetical protein EHM47_15235, partial [Ignavibacteriales bacterium]
MKIYRIYFIALLFIGGCSSSELVINKRNVWSANDPLPYKSHIPFKITIHHEGVVFNKGENAPEHIKVFQVWGMGPDRKWTDIPYHFLIDPEGNIYEGR